eukprot:08755.XXX_240213_240479_1 [CDS] Oithona nana genome sequencing.
MQTGVHSNVLLHYLVRTVKLPFVFPTKDRAKVGIVGILWKCRIIINIMCELQNSSTLFRCTFGAEQVIDDMTIASFQPRISLKKRGPH